MTQLNLDKNTFGDNPADLYLVDLLNQPENSIYIRKVGRRLSSSDHILGQLVLMDLPTRKTICCSLRRTFNEVIDEMVISNQTIKDLMKNHIATRIKLLIKPCKK